MSSDVSSLPCIYCRSSISNLDTLRSSPCPHLLHSNRPPSQLEASSIRQAIVQARNDQERLKREITQLQATIDALHKQSSTIETFISEHEAVLAPARRIPPEILAEIFLWCFAGNKLSSAKDAPIVLGKVCRYWRSVTISTPKLWSTLNLNVYGMDLKPNSWLVNAALSRSGACPLTISMGLCKHVDSCLDAILNHSHRWKSVSFRLHSLGLRKLSAGKHALPLLEALDIQEESSQANEVVVDIFEAAPRLRSLRTNMSPSLLKVPGEQLEYFGWDGGSQKECLEWLHRCPNLNKCQLTIYEGFDIELSSLLMVRLSRLNKLGIEWGVEKDEFVLEDLFNHLVTPVLSDLRIEYEYVYLTEWAQPSFISFLCRSTCALRKLNLTDIPITDVQLIECLCMLPSLVELIIVYNGIDSMFFPVTDTLLRRLIYRPPNLRSLPLLSPQLQDITFEGDFMVDDRIFGDMVASRWRIHGMGIDDPTFEIARLKSMEWRQYRNLDSDEETRGRLEKYKDEGLKLYIS